MYKDEVGGFHEDAIGWNPQGVWCGECTRGSCKGCPNRHKTVPAYEEKVEQVFVIECTAWDEPEIHKTYRGAFEGLIENIKNMYSDCVENYSDNLDATMMIANAYEQYNQGRKKIRVEDGNNCYYLYPVDLMN